MRHQQLLVLIELALLDHGPARLRAAAPSELAFRTPFSALKFLFLNSSETQTGNGELTFSRAQAPAKLRRARKALERRRAQAVPCGDKCPRGRRDP
jgi:hypothetical protein